MGTLRASIPDPGRAAIIAALMMLPACGQAAPTQTKQEASKMATVQTDNAQTDNPATKYAAEGHLALANGDYAAADTAFDQAIATIGDSYVDTHALDDTGMQLILADSKSKKGDHAGAAKLKAQIVKSRLAQLAAKQH